MLPSWLHSLEYSFVLILLQSLGRRITGNRWLVLIFLHYILDNYWLVAERPLIFGAPQSFRLWFWVWGGALSKPLSTAFFFSGGFNLTVDTTLSHKRFRFYGSAPTELELGRFLTSPRDSNCRVEGNVKADRFLSDWEWCNFSDRGLFRYSLLSITNFVGRQVSSLIS